MRRRGALLLGLFVAVGLALRLSQLGADPPLQLSLSNAEVMDGPWYFAEAVDRARGREADVPPQYRKPLFTALMRLGFVGGVSLERAHAVAALAGGLLVILGAGAAYTAFGARSALLTAFWLATGFVPVGYGRTAVVYGPMAAGVAAVLWCFAAAYCRAGQPLEAGRDRVRRVVGGLLAWTLLGGLVLWLQPVALALAPALALGHLVAAPRRGRALLALAAGGALALLIALAVDPYLVRLTLAKVTGYAGGVEPLVVLKRWLRAPFASGLWPKAPLLCLLAWLGVLAVLADRRGSMNARPQAVVATLASAFATWVGLFALFEYPEGGTPPLRYFVPALVPGAILAAWVLDRLLGPGLALGAPRLVLLAWGGLAAYWGLGTFWTGVWPLAAPGGPAWLPTLVAFPALLAGAVAFGIALALAAPRLGRPSRLPPRAVALLLGAGLVADASYLYPALAWPTYSLRDANRAVAQLLGPGAAVAGPFAHALTYAAPHVTRHHVERLEIRSAEGLLEPKARGFTHFAVDGRKGEALEPRFRAIGVPLHPLARLAIRGHPVTVYRFAWAEELGYRLSPLEQALRQAGGSG